MATMTKSSKNRVSIALALGFFAVLAQLGAFTAIGMNAWNDLTSPTSSSLTLPLTISSEPLRGELVYPVLRMKFLGRAVIPGGIACFRCFDPQTGKQREIPGANVDLTITGAWVGNGERMWAMGGGTVCETDGRTVVEYEPKRLLGVKATTSMIQKDSFIHEGRPFIIDTEPNGNFRLLALIDREWVDQGQIAFPGADRSLTVDERTGNTVLVPRTSANSTDNGKSFSEIQVFSSNGRIHLFQSCGGAHVCYREGFDFVPSPADAEVVSAMSPANAPADTTGWVLLDSSIASKMFNLSLVVFKDDLYVVDDDQIWRMSISSGLTASSRFEEVAKIDHSGDGMSVLVASPQDNSLYVISASQVFDADVFRIVDGKLQKMPYHLDGFFESFKRWLGILLLQGLVVMTVVTMALIGISARMTGSSVYSFGQNTVLLAPIVRRSLARCVDLVLILGPLMLHLTWLVWRINGVSLESAIERISDGSGTVDILPDMIWICLMWAAIVVSTGVWGSTPGKWLFGVRVVRTTLRPCGIFAALLRELLMFLDAPQLLTALPGLLCFLATENGQRIGDLAAGTLVIDAQK
jgi:uncharacterized RDD family membrane protein YckC